MRQTLLILVLAALAVLACAQTVVKETTVEVAWDAPTIDSSGADLLPEDLVSYKIWIQDTRTGVTTLMGETAAVEFTVSVPYRSTWRIGVTALLDGLESAMAWSTVAEDVEAGKTFVLRPRGNPGKPTGLERP